MQDPDSSRLFKGRFNLRQPLPKYIANYDPEIILNFINELQTNKWADDNRKVNEEIMHAPLFTQWTTLTIITNIKIDNISILKLLIYLSPW